VVIGAILERASPYDLLVTREPEPLASGAVVGTSSLRRRAQLASALPAVRTTEIRGNVDTRLRRMEEGVVDGLVLAEAGLARLGIRPAHARAFSVTQMVPAPGQGALAVQVRTHDVTVREIVRQLDHLPSRQAVEAERRLMGALGGGCDLPLGAFAEIVEGEVRLAAIVVRPDGRDPVRVDVSGSRAPEVAERAARQLLSAGAAEILVAVRS